MLEATDLGILTNITPRLATLINDDNKCNDFLNTLNTGLQAVGPDCEATDLYSVLLYAYLSSDDPESCTRLSTTFDDSFLDFLKTEIGMHRNEFELFEQTINLLRQLMKYGDPFKLRARHRDHVVSNRAFPMAMMLATRFHYLDPGLIVSWSKVITKN